MEILTIVLLIAIIGLFLYSNQKMEKSLSLSTQKIKEDLKQDLLLELAHQKEEITDRVVDKVSMVGELQSAQIRDIKSGLDLSFETIKSAQALTHSDQIQAQQTQSLEIKSAQKDSLIELQTMIQNSLSKAIMDLANLNNQNFANLQKTNQDKLDQINLQVQNRLDQSFAQHQKSFEEVSRNVGQLQQMANRMIDSTSSIDKLNNIFARTSSKSFGDFGERYLESLLTQSLHPSGWSKQVKMSYSADKIDFVIYIDDQKIGIDSKFPMTRYQDYLECETPNKAIFLKEFHKSVKLMAQDIATKYGKNSEMDFLFMYLPSDGMYVTVVENAEIIAELQKLKVTPVSPITIFPVISGAKNYQDNKYINENAKAIMQGLEAIKKNVASFQEEFRKLGDKIKQAQLNYDKAGQNLVNVDNTIAMLGRQETKSLESQGELL
jgi:DNA recombination protein RmuC